jgi:hypothetical protein
MLLEKTYEAVVDAGQQLLCPLVAGKWSWLVTGVVHLETNSVSRWSMLLFSYGNESQISLPFNSLEAAPSGSEPIYLRLIFIVFPFILISSGWTFL